jgi:hypothetical protein
MADPVPPQTADHEDPAALARALEPALTQACEGRLIGPVEWFRASWQRGGAATGNARWADGSEDPLPVIIKLPVGHAELSWTARLGTHGSDRDVPPNQTPHPTPRVLASGADLGGYDLGWLVLERLEGALVSGDLSSVSLQGLIEAAAEFQFRAHGSTNEAREPDAARPEPDWAGIIERSLESIRVTPIDEEHRWAEAIKLMRRHAEGLIAEWSARPMKDWCHGDLHPGNALHMRGDSGHPGRCVLIDLGLVHRGHWVEDAVYLERVFWGHEDRLEGLDVVRSFREARKRRGLAARPSDGRYANLKRVLSAGCMPARRGSERGDGKYAAASLSVLERLLPTLLG